MDWLKAKPVDFGQCTFLFLEATNFISEQGLLPFCRNCLFQLTVSLSSTHDINDFLYHTLCFKPKQYFISDYASRFTCDIEKGVFLDDALFYKTVCMCLKEAF